MQAHNEAAIYCYWQGESIGRMIFYNLDPLPASSYYGSLAPGKKVELEIVFHLDRFNDIINIVRYEKPLSFDFKSK
jgi:hypothetical protein